MSGRVSALESSLSNQLQNLLEFGFINKEKGVITTCLHSYLTIGRANLAEELFQKKIVEPGIEKIVNVYDIIIFIYDMIAKYNQVFQNS
jgi:hypothetical protein